MRLEPSNETARLLAEGIARLGIERLPWTKVVRQWRDRILFLRRVETGTRRERSSGPRQLGQSEGLASATAANEVEKLRELFDGMKFSVIGRVTSDPRLRVAKAIDEDVRELRQIHEQAIARRLAANG